MLNPKYFVLFLLLGCETIFAAQPFDVEYRISGAESIRPALVFNDGTDTFIQPGADDSIRVEGYQYEHVGPYIVVRGIKERIVLEGSGNRRISVIYTGAALTPDMLLPANATHEPAPECESSDIEAKHVDLFFAPKSVTPGDEMRKTLDAAIEGLSASSRIIVWAGETTTGSVGDKRAAVIRDYLVKRGVSASRIKAFSMVDSNQQSYMIIESPAKVPCKRPSSKPTLVFSPELVKPSTSHNPEIQGRNQNDASQSDDADPMATKLEKLAAKAPAKPEKPRADGKPASPIFAINTSPATNEAPTISGKFIVENSAPINVSPKVIPPKNGHVFKSTEFAGSKALPGTMSDLSKLVDGKTQVFYVVRSDGSSEGKGAADLAAKSLKRLGVENTHTELGAEQGTIQIDIEGEGK